MPIQTKKEIEDKLAQSAKRSRQVREAVIRIKEALASTETETIPSAVSLIKPAFSPVG